jgi:hypothetical protein
MYFSERRKQGLASLRPGYGLGDIVTGNLINYAAPKLFDYAFKSKEQREKEKLERDMKKLGIYGYFPEGTGRDDDDETNKTPSTFKGAFKGGLMNLLATAVLGPIMGPLALTVGRGIMNKSKNLGFTGGNGGSGVGPKGPTGKNIDYYTGSDEEDKDNEWDPSAPTAPSAPSHIGPTGQDIHGNGDSGSSGSTGSMSASDFSDDSPGTPFFKGGRVSYSKGGIASLWQR